MEEDRFEALAQEWSVRPENYSNSMKEDQLGKKEDVEVSENAKPSAALMGSTAAGGGAVLANNADDNEDTANLVSRSRRNSGSDDDKQGAGDTKNTSDYLQDNDSGLPKKAKPGHHDKMDGVYVKQPSNKRRGERSDDSAERSGKCDRCIVDCLYYSMQCCHCNIM